MIRIKLTIYLLLLINVLLFCMPNMEGKKYNVGFRYYTEYDSSRLYIYNQDTINRPMLVHFWYPSKEKSENGNMNYKQYVNLISIREDFLKEKETIEQDSYNFVNAYAQFAQKSYGIGLNISTQQILESPVKASLNLEIEKGEFPLIIYAPSNSKSSIQNHVICEYLASNGFYVISVSSAGPNSIERKNFKQSVLAQVKDMEFILNFIKTNNNINYSSIGLLGFSTGGLATAIFQMKHKSVSAIFNMDGSNEYSMYLSLSKFEDYDISKTGIPYFLVGNQNKQSIYPYYNSIRTENKFYFKMLHLSHFGFVSFWTYFDTCNPDTTQHDFSKSYELICESASTFFDATLNENKKSNGKLSGMRNQKNNFAVYEQLDCFETMQLLNTFLSENINVAIATYKNHKAQNFNDYNYNEEEISLLGRMLIDYDIDAAIKLLQFNRDEYPASWHVYYDLAFSYKIKGDFNSAKTTLLKALELGNDNKDVKDLLKELESKSS
mgnify:CR=1 FL=1